MLPEEGEHQPLHAGGAIQHHLEDAPGMGGGVKRERQRQHMLEEGRHDRQPAPVRQSVRMQRDEHAAADGEEPEPDPCSRQRQEIAPGGRDLGRLCARQEVDDAPEQHGLGELGDSEKDVGEGEEPSQPGFRTQLPEHPEIQADEAHAKRFQKALST